MKIKCHKTISKHDDLILPNNLRVPFPMEYARQGHISVLVNLKSNQSKQSDFQSFSHILIFGGRGASTNRSEKRKYLNDVCICDLKTGKWKPIHVGKEKNFEI